MEQQFWAKRGKDQITGPLPTREEALDAFREAYPHTGPQYMARAKQNQILTGYGLNGPWADMRWHDAAASAEV